MTQKGADSMQEAVEKLLQLGTIPPDDEMSDALFRQYDELIQSAEPLSTEEAEALISLFSEDCYDLNDGLMRLIESAFPADRAQTEQYRAIIAKCSNDEFRELLETRLNNALKQ